MGDGPRIAPVDRPDPDQRELLRTVTGDPDDAPNLFRTLVRHPRLMKRANLLAGLFLARGDLPARDREVVILRVAARTGCAYEQDHHLRLARDVGLTGDEVRVVTAGPAAEAGEELGPVLALVDGLLDDHVAPDAAWAALAPRYDDAQLLELLALVGFYALLAGVANTLRTPLDSATRTLTQ